MNMFAFHRDSWKKSPFLRRYPRTPAVMKTTQRWPRLSVAAYTTIPTSDMKYTARVVCLQKRHGGGQVTRGPLESGHLDKQPKCF